MVRNNVSLNIVEVSTPPRRRDLISSSLRSSPSNAVVKVRKTVQHVRLLGLPGEFTSVTVEQVEGDREDFEIVSICPGRLWCKIHIVTDSGSCVSGNGIWAFTTIDPPGGFGLVRTTNVDP